MRASRTALRPAPPPTDVPLSAAGERELDSSGARGSDSGAGLIARIRAGDVQAFRQLFFAFYRPLCVYAAGYLRSDDIAEEIVQDLLLNIWASRATWQVKDDLERYLFGAARNRALNAVRNRDVADRWEKRAASEPEIPGMGQAPPAADAAVKRADLAAALDRAIRRLPERQRQTIMLRWRGQLSHADVAKVMGVSIKAVEINLSRAFRVLREELSAFR
jgi:RNA polymerase sigma-70 factor (ECF subfamily)